MRDWKAAWLRERLKNSVTAWAVCVWKVWFKTHQSLLCRIALTVNQTWRPVHWLFTRKRICDILKLLTWLGQPLALSQITERKYNILKENKSVRRLLPGTARLKEFDMLSVPSISHDTCERVVTFCYNRWSNTTRLKELCCQYRYCHTTRLKELWCVVSTDDVTPHVWKSSEVLSVRMILHHTSKRVVTCYQYGWYKDTCLKELWRVISTDDLTPHVWKSCDVLSVRMISHNHVKRCSGLPL